LCCWKFKPQFTWSFSVRKWKIVICNPHIQLPSMLHQWFYDLEFTNSSKLLTYLEFAATLYKIGWNSLLGWRTYYKRQINKRNEHKCIWHMFFEVIKEA
jgi:hypothetical protein